jgi:7-cyano-7-deazaguanine synthase
MPPSAIVLVSGGLDSATLLALAAADGFEPYALTIDYGQRHRFEVAASRRVCAAAGVARHLVLSLDLRAIGGSALTTDVAVPKDRSSDEMSLGIPVTYVPARNTIFLSLALGWAESLGALDLFIGVNATDHAGYPDCRAEFINAFQHLANHATKSGSGTAGWRIHTPLIELSKAEIIRRGLTLGVDYSLTHTCYDPGAGGEPCDHCDACLLRQAGFREAGVSDPLTQTRPA